MKHSNNTLLNMAIKLSKAVYNYSVPPEPNTAIIFTKSENKTVVYLNGLKDQTGKKAHYQLLKCLMSVDDITVNGSITDNCQDFYWDLFSMVNNDLKENDVLLVAYSGEASSIEATLYTENNKTEMEDLLLAYTDV